MTKTVRADGSRCHALRQAVCRVLPALLCASLARASNGDVSRDVLCVTDGTVQDSAQGFTVDSPQLRAFVRLPIADEAQLHFTYLGPTDQQVALGSGVVRAQLGLKLRAADPCNLIYVMWRITPEPKLVVQTKSNPGQRTSHECGNRGYQTVKGERTTPVPGPRAGESHVLQAQITADRLRASIDGRVVWQGAVAGAGAFTGPVGMRSDNVRYSFRLNVGPGSPLAGTLPACDARESGE
jgi:hypothetical protein